VLSAVLLCFASLDPWGFLDPPIFLEIAREVFFYQNLMISPEMKNERVLGTIRSKRGQFDPNSTRFNIKCMKIRDQIRAKIRSNRGLTCFHVKISSPLFLLLIFAEIPLLGITGTAFANRA